MRNSLTLWSVYERLESESPPKLMESIRRSLVPQSSESGISAYLLNLSSNGFNRVPDSCTSDGRKWRNKRMQEKWPLLEK